MDYIDTKGEGNCNEIFCYVQSLTNCTDAIISSSEPTKLVSELACKITAIGRFNKYMQISTSTWQSKHSVHNSFDFSNLINNNFRYLC